ncbi:FlgO family outer membrane protein [Fundidesulfovibrio soli]|uniref:FlgO family outer membrane protein n=1 Tax=Fundidesulfovibrio soli TaxID=2922716 RepID=UPI001FAE80AD|nr:FlgO family outer membrane protein [Fundidesulfovibrio soli]
MPIRALSLTFVLVLALAVSVIGGPAAAQQPPQAKPFKIAILEFDAVTDEALKENLGRVTAEFLITSAVNSGSFSVVERAALKKVLDEMQFGQGSNAPGTVAQAIGSMVGAQGVLTGSVAKTGASVRLDARLVDVATGSIVAARNAYAKGDLRSIATAAELLVSQLEGDLSRLTPPAPKPEPDVKAEAKPEAKPELKLEQKQPEARPQAQDDQARNVPPQGEQAPASSAQQ